jgi:hypothetical protein
MGAKIITEKDFWMCTSGAMPAQLQGTRTSNKKSSGEVYITVADTATSSWIDFGCTKNMLFAALIAAVVAVVVVALIVGTGGIAAIGLLGMMAIGAGAGIIGGTIAAVHGALKCGQKNATQRQWSDSKKNLILTGTPAITGAHTMTCKIGGTVSFAPEVKSWLHAISLGGLNYLTRFAECALGGAAVGGGGYLFAGLASGSIALAAPTVGSVVSNVTTGFTGVWGASRALFGLNNVANEHAYGRVQNGTDALLAAGNGAVPEVGMASRILTGNAEPTDYMLFLYLLNVKAGRNAPQNQKPATNGDKDGNVTNKKEGNTNKTPEDDGAQPPKGEGEPSTNNNSGGKKGDAFEDGTAPRYGNRRISDELYEELRDQTPSQDIRDMVNEGVELPMADPVLPGKTITRNLHADHIVSMDKITRMEGFDRLTRQQQLKVLNNRENFVGLSESANTSKGAKSYQDWTMYKRENIPVDPDFRNLMIQREAQVERILQQQIDDFLNTP